MLTLAGRGSARGGEHPVGGGAMLLHRRAHEAGELRAAQLQQGGRRVGLQETVIAFMPAARQRDGEREGGREEERGRQRKGGREAGMQRDRETGRQGETRRGREAGRERETERQTQRDAARPRGGEAERWRGG